MLPHDNARFSPSSHGGKGMCSGCGGSRPAIVDERSDISTWRAHCYIHAWDRDALRALFGIPERKIIYVERDATMEKVAALAAEIHGLIDQHPSEYW
jgi:hypothetical protein